MCGRDARTTAGGDAGATRGGAARRQRGYSGESGAKNEPRRKPKQDARRDRSRSETPETLRPKTDPPVATIAEIGRHEGQSVTLQGWLYNSRESGKLLFPIFRDGTGSIQGVAHVKSVTPEVFEKLKGLTQESSVIVTGKVRADKRAPGGYELDVEDVRWCSACRSRTRTRSR